MDDLEKGTWIVNSTKKLTAFQQNSAALQSFEATEQAGKAGNLLARLLNEKEEIVNFQKLKAFARQSFLSTGEIRHTLDLLKSQGKVDFNLTPNGQVDEVETYCFSNRDALKTVAGIFDHLQPSPVESGSLLSLEATYQLPRTVGEVKEILTGHAGEASAQEVIDLQTSLQFVRIGSADGYKILYNEHAFAEGAEKIAYALRALSPHEKQNIEDVLEQVKSNQGQPLDELVARFNPTTIGVMTGIGLLDAMPVFSRYGQASFVTTPHLAGVSIEGHSASLDVFHKAKSLLNCLRYGQYKSAYRRGLIDSSEKMLRIVRKLLRGELMGPCTAIGQDYVVLETAGVISTVPAENGMYYMQLRQKEVGVLVLQMLIDQRIAPELEADLSPILASQPSQLGTPESERTAVLANQAPEVRTATDRLLQAIRSKAGRRL